MEADRRTQNRFTATAATKARAAWMSRQYESGRAALRLFHASRRAEEPDTPTERAIKDEMIAAWMKNHRVKKLKPGHAWMGRPVIEN